MSFFSIIIPAFNVEQYVEECLDSIEKQTFNDYEVVIVDDASTDGTYSLVKKCAMNNKRINASTIPHVVVGEVRNRAIDISSGKYLVFVDADDRLEPDMLQRIHDVLEENPADICFLPNHYVEFVDRIVEHNLIPVFSEDDTFFATREEFISFVVKRGGTVPSSMWTAVCNRDLVVEHGIRMDSKFIWSQDSDFMYQVLSKSQNVAVCGYRGYVWNRKNVISATRLVTAKKVNSRLDVYKKWYNLLDESCFGELDYKTADYMKRSLLRNYCEVLTEYSFMKDKKEREIVRSKFEEDKLWDKDKSLIPEEYAKYGLKLGRESYRIKHYLKVIGEKVKGNK